MKQVPMVGKIKALLRKNPKINLADMKIPFTNGEETLPPKSILEESVDSKYYIGSHIMERLSKQEGFQEKISKLKERRTTTVFNRKDGVGKEIDAARCLSSSDWRGLNGKASVDASCTDIAPTLRSEAHGNDPLAVIAEWN